MQYDYCDTEKAQKSLHYRCDCDLYLLDGALNFLKGDIDEEGYVRSYNGYDDFLILRHCCRKRDHKDRAYRPSYR